MFRYFIMCNAIAMLYVIIFTIYKGKFIKNGWTNFGNYFDGAYRFIKWHSMLLIPIVNIFSIYIMTNLIVIMANNKSGGNVSNGRLVINDENNYMDFVG